MQFSHMFSPDGLTNTLLSRGCVLEMDLAMGTVCVIHVPDSTQGQRRGRSHWSPGFNSWVNQQTCPLGDRLQKQQKDVYAQDGLQKANM